MVRVQSRLPFGSPKQSRQVHQTRTVTGFAGFFLSRCVQAPSALDIVIGRRRKTGRDFMPEQWHTDRLAAYRRSHDGGLLHWVSDSSSHHCIRFTTTKTTAPNRQPRNTRRSGSTFAPFNILVTSCICGSARPAHRRFPMSLSAESPGKRDWPRAGRTCRAPCPVSSG